WQHSRLLRTISHETGFKHAATRMGLDLISHDSVASEDEPLFHEDGVCIQDDLVIQWKVVSLEKCIVRSSKIFECKNCIFTGDVQVLLEDTDCSPVIETSIFLRNLEICTTGVPPPTLEISSCFVKRLRVRDSEMSRV